jgi:RNA polymerase sigma factor (sigma-70 family)
MTSDILRTELHRDFSAAQAGDKRAYGRLMARTQGMVMGIALTHTRDVQLSQDIAQETFLRGWLRLSDISSAEGFLPWLRQVTRNQALDHFRSSRYREVALGPDDQRMLSQASSTATPEEHALDIELGDWLREAIDQVPTESREVLMLYQQVAALLDMTDASVRKRLQRARDALNQQFLQSFEGAARRAAPGSAIAAAVLAAIGGSGSTLAKAAGMGGAAKAGSFLASAGGVIAGLTAAVGAVFVGVFLEVRSVMGPMRTLQRRRAMVVNGVVYAALMAGFILALRWVKAEGWNRSEILTMSILVSILVIALAAHRAWLVKRDQTERG